MKTGSFGSRSSATSNVRGPENLAMLSLQLNFSTQPLSRRRARAALRPATASPPACSSARGRPCERSTTSPSLAFLPGLAAPLIPPHPRRLHGVQAPSALPPSAAAAALAPGDATPTHPRALRGLYIMYLCACLVERTWRFALPLVLAFVDGGYQAIAVLGFVSPLACSLLGPAVGRTLDRVYRPYGLGVMVALQGVAIIASGLVVLTAASNPVTAIADGPLFAALLLLSMVERLTAIASELAIERDWVTQLSGELV